MGSAAGHLDLNPEVALVRQANVEGGGLGDDGAIDFQVLNQAGRAEAAVLLVRHGSHHDIAAQADAGLGECLDGGHAGGQAPFHIVRAAAIDFAVADFAGERVGHAGDVDRVGVGVEHQAAPSARARETAGDRGAAVGGLVDLDLESRGP